MKKLTFLFIALFVGLSAMAHDFSVVNNGKTIYYNITSSTSPRTVEVTFRGEAYNTYDSEYTGDVVIPASVIYDDNSYSVASIGVSAFRDCPLTSVTIPNSVASIGGDAFYNCRSLSSATIGNSVTSIGYGAFYYCVKLSSITIPYSVTAIGSSAFRGCMELSSVTIPNLVVSIGADAFVSCYKLTSINVSSGNQHYSSENGVLFNKDKKTLVYYPGGKTGAYTIPNSVTSIGNSAFYDCRLISSVIIPNSVTSIENTTFYNCHLLSSVTIPNSVASIGHSAFYDCRSLTSITIPSSVTSIEDMAFANCTGLQAMIVKRTTPVSINANVFNYLTTSNIKLLVPNNSVALYSAASVWKDFDIEEISFFAAHNSEIIYYNITSPVEPRTVEVTYAPGGYSGDIVIPASASKGGNSYSVTSIGEFALGGSLSLNSVTLPSSVTVIGDYAFFESENLASINIPNSVISIGNGAFFYCIGLTSVDIPNSVVSIGDGAFSECYYLASLTIGNSVNSIGEGAFNWCTGLTSVTIPNSVTTIGESAFENCEGLTDVTVKWTTPLSINANVFNNLTPSNIKLHVPVGTKALYSAADVWKDFNIEEPSNIFTVKDIPLSLYPNPVIDELKINTDCKINSVQVIDITGKMVYSSFFVNNNSINVSALPSGVYLVKIDTDKGTKTERVVKN
jgi:hypothetical protein